MLGCVAPMTTLEKLANLRPGVRLQPHQQRVVDRVGKGSNGLLLYHGLGTGKSLAAIAAAEGTGDAYSIVAPASLRANFKKEVDKFTTGSAPEVKSYTELALGGEFNATPETLIVDEAHRMRNPDTASAQAIQQLAKHAKRVLLLTGSPITNEPSDLAPLLSAVTGTPVSPDEFNARFVGRRRVKPTLLQRLSGVTHGEAPELINENELRNLVRGHIDYQAGKRPDGVKVDEEVIRVPLSTDQKRIQAAIRTRIPPTTLWKLDRQFPLSEEELARMNSFLSGLRQASLSTLPFRVDGDPAAAYDQSEKIKSAVMALRATLRSDPRKKALVYSNFVDAGLATYAAGLDKAKIPHGVFHGGVSEAQRQKALADYNAGRIRALLIGPAGAEGISTKGTNLIQLLDPHWHESRLQQAQGRGLRFDSHDGLPDDLKNVRVQRYISSSLDPHWFRRLLGARRQLTGDELLEAMGARKEVLNEQFRKILKEEGTMKKAHVGMMKIATALKRPLPEDSLAELSDDRLRYVVQHHQQLGGREHLDLRLGTPDVGLHSWAVPTAKLPDPGEKRPLVQTPVHDYGYGEFQGPLRSGHGVVRRHAYTDARVLARTPNTLRLQADGREMTLLRSFGKDGKVKWHLLGHVPTAEVSQRQKTAQAGLPESAVYAFLRRKDVQQRVAEERDHENAKKRATSLKPLRTAGILGGLGYGLMRAGDAALSRADRSAVDDMSSLGDLLQAMPDDPKNSGDMWYEYVNRASRAARVKPYGYSVPQAVVGLRKLLGKLDGTNQFAVKTEKDVSHATSHYGSFAKGPIAAMKHQNERQTGIDTHNWLLADDAERGVSFYTPKSPIASDAPLAMQDGKLPRISPEELLRRTNASIDSYLAKTHPTITPAAAENLSTLGHSQQMDVLRGAKEMLRTTDPVLAAIRDTAELRLAKGQIDPLRIYGKLGRALTRITQDIPRAVGTTMLAAGGASAAYWAARRLAYALRKKREKTRIAVTALRRLGVDDVAKTAGDLHDWDGTLIPRLRGNAAQYRAQLEKLTPSDLPKLALPPGGVSIATARPPLFHDAILKAAKRLGIKVLSIQHAPGDKVKEVGEAGGTITDDDPTIVDAVNAKYPGRGILMKAAEYTIDEKLRRLRARRGECLSCAKVPWKCTCAAFVDPGPENLKKSAALVIEKKKRMVEQSYQDCPSCGVEWHEKGGPWPKPGDEDIYVCPHCNAELEYPEMTDEEISKVIPWLREGMIEQRERRRKRRAEKQATAPHADDLATAEKQVEANPSPEQAKAGNYRKGHFRMHGLCITLETAKGQFRRGIDRKGKAWAVKMPVSYGYVKRTVSEADEDHIDVFVGPKTASRNVYVIDQVNGEGKFDEHKCMLGFDNQADAVATYKAAYTNIAPYGGCTPVTWEQFRWWIHNGDTSNPIAGQPLEAKRDKRTVVTKAATNLPQLKVLAADGTEKVAVGIEFATTPETRAAGLANREKLADGTGMLFDTPGPFWMKGCTIPLDLTWLSRDGKVLKTAQMPVPASARDLRLYHPPTGAVAALETNLGWAQKHSVLPGDIITMEIT